MKELLNEELWLTEEDLIIVTAQWPGKRPDDLNSSSITHVMEGLNSQKLSSDYCTSYPEVNVKKKYVCMLTWHVCTCNMACEEDNSQNQLSPPRGNLEGLGESNSGLYLLSYLGPHLKMFKTALGGI